VVVDQDGPRHPALQQRVVVAVDIEGVDLGHLLVTERPALIRSAMTP
jgi:hypothetical protein